MSEIKRPDLDAIEAEANLATKEPWEVKYAGLEEDVREFFVYIPAPNFFLDMLPMTNGGVPYEPICFEWTCNKHVTSSNTQAIHDAKFMAASRKNIPELVAYARQLENSNKLAIEILQQLIKWSNESTYSKTLDLSDIIENASNLIYSNE